MKLLSKWTPRELLVVIVFLQSIVFFMTFFNVPIARQIVGFMFFTFVPGFIAIKLLKSNELDGLETILFSLGFSVAFLILAGFFINEFGLLCGISQPLSLMPLMIILNSLILIGGILVYLRSECVKLSGEAYFSPAAMLFVCLPILSIAGTMWINAYENNALLLFMIIILSILFVVGIFSKKLLPSKLYPFALLMMAIAILYHSSLISNYIVTFGSDISIEYHVFQNTKNNAYWSSTYPFFWSLGYGRINAMLSVTVLPTIYSTLLNIDSTWLFKALFPLIFSFVPLGLYLFWQTFISKKYAFVSVFVFMAQPTFYSEMLGLSRQMIAELFFVLLLLVIVNEKLKPSSKIVCFMIFGFALVTSHYSLAEIFFFFVSLTLISLLLLKYPSRNVTLSMVIVFFVMMFTWYIFTSNSAVFESLLGFGEHIRNQLGDFFNPLSRGQEVLRGLGMEAPPTIWNMVSRVFAYATQALIVVGFAGSVMGSTRTPIRKEVFTLSLTAMVFLAALIMVPGLANSLNMTRFYHILLFFLAPFCVLGAEVLVKLVFKRKRELAIFALLLIVLIPYFLFQMGFVYEITRNDTYSFQLSKYRMSPLRLYGASGITDTYSVFGVQWLSRNVDARELQVYADSISQSHVLTVYGMIYSGHVSELSNITVVASNGIVYLNALNVIHKTVVYGELLLNSSELSSQITDLNVVYANGASYVYKNSP